MNVMPIDAGLGAEIQGLDISQPLDDKTIASVRAAWLDHSVLLLRGQTLNQQQLLAFTRQLGDLELPPTQALGLKSGIAQKDDVPPEINVISNVKENGVPIGQLGAGEAAWHTDSAFFEEPPAGSILYAVEIPPKGGNTSFLNMYRALETLPPELRSAIDERSAKHDYTYTSTGNRRKDYPEVADPSQAPGPKHPMVRNHPESGRKALYLGRRLNGYIMGLPVDESEALLDQLWAHTMQPEFMYEHIWHVGDVVMWDNRCVMHRREAFDDSTRRVMLRTQLKGDRPYR